VPQDVRVAESLTPQVTVFLPALEAIGTNVIAPVFDAIFGASSGPPWLATLRELIARKRG